MNFSPALDQIVAIQAALSIVGIPNPTTYAAAVIARTPVAYWRFTETPSNLATIADASGNGRDAIARNPSGGLTRIAGLVTADLDTCYNHAPIGNGDYLELPDVAALNLAGQAISIAFIAQATTPGNYGTLAQKLNGANGWVLQGHTGATPLTFSYNANSNQAGFTAMTLWDGLPHVCLVTWDGVNVRFYVDRLLRQTVALAGTCVSAAGHIGSAFSDPNAGGSDFFGANDELALFNTVLTLADHQAMYDAAIDALAGTGKTVARVYRVPPRQSSLLPDLPCWMNSVDLPEVDFIPNAQRLRTYVVSMQFITGDAENDIAREVALAFLEAAVVAFQNALTLHGTCAWFTLRGGSPTLAVFTWGGREFVGLQLFLDVHLYDVGVAAA